MEKIKMLGLAIDNVSMEEAADEFEKLVNADGLSIVVTANPEILNNATKNEELAKLIQDAPLVVPDGMSLVLLSKLKGQAFKERVAGIDFAYMTLKRSAKIGKKVFLLGGKPGVAKLAAQNLEKEIEGLNIVGTHDGYFIEDDEPKIVELINDSEADVLLVAMGSPRQEFFLSRHQNELKAKLGVGIGGSLDVWSGNISRAPQFYIDHNIEWLYRLKKEPERFGRMAKIPGFMLKVLLEKEK